MNVALTTIDPVLRVEDICRVLKIERRTFYDLKARGWFGEKGPALVEVEPRVDRHPRYAGEPFVKWLSDRTQQKLWRQELRALERVG